ncbi:hypothetical protein Csa_021952 [Cucumis sativus]|uniref:Uncharacterized protein n=1 Tax=Cucumis sativus TaxID=3659 RepID=A0A0A0LP57_CUCSA|nr:hypothetical protein Csa_021952 [Cucumis sativus]
MQSDKEPDDVCDTGGGDNVNRRLCKLSEKFHSAVRRRQFVKMRRSNKAFLRSMVKWLTNCGAVSFLGINKKNEKEKEKGKREMN